MNTHINTKKKKKKKKRRRTRGDENAEDEEGEREGEIIKQLLSFPFLLFVNAFSPNRPN